MAREGLIWFDVDVFQDALDSAIGEMETVVKAAIKSTMRRTRSHARTLISSIIREKWNISKTDLDKKIQLRIRQPTRNYYESFEVMIKGISISLSYFGAKQFADNRVITRKVGRQNKRRSKFQGTEVEVIKGRKTKLSGVFLQATDNGHMMVMRRKGKGRYPLEIKASISMASMYGGQRSGNTADRFEEGLLDYIERTFEHELNWRLSQAGLI
jgi:hypothetical protein